MNSLYSGIADEFKLYYSSLVGFCGFNDGSKGLSFSDELKTNLHNRMYKYIKEYEKYRVQVMYDILTTLPNKVHDFHLNFSEDYTKLSNHVFYQLVKRFKIDIDRDCGLDEHTYYILNESLRPKLFDELFKVKGRYMREYYRYLNYARACVILNIVPNVDFLLFFDYIQHNASYFEYRHENTSKRTLAEMVKVVLYNVGSRCGADYGRLIIYAENMTSYVFTQSYKQLKESDDSTLTLFDCLNFTIEQLKILNDQAK